MSTASTAGARRGHGFGSMPVFLAGISTILGAVLFLRFGYAVGHASPLGAALIVVIGHLVTIPTALAISEIATNRRVEGGGEYFIISRSFGLRIGGAIGVALFLSQAISVAFYCVAFAEAFRPLAPLVESTLGVPFDPRMVSLPLAAGLVLLMWVNGASLGVRALYVVFAVLVVSLGMFFAGSPTEAANGRVDWLARVDGHDPFFLTFAIVFPAFTGMTQGVGLSGDLAQPRVSIPRGTLAATLSGMVVYLALIWKFSTSASVDALAHDDLVMTRVALWGPIIPIGLACATLSSAIGSLLVAPRTLQALARDELFYPRSVNRWLGSGHGAEEEPRAATLLTAGIVGAMVALGDVDFVARLISMFFMVTYGALCSISLLEHFGGNPSYRPTFRSRWWISAIGAGMCLFLMFQMDPVYAAVSLLAMAGFYTLTAYTPAARPAAGQDRGLAALLRAVMAQLSRRLRIRLQQATTDGPADARDWRPSIVTVRTDTFEAPHDVILLLGWLSSRYGFGTYLHHLVRPLDRASYAESQRLRPDLVDLCEVESPGVFAETVVSPSREDALAHALQLPGGTGASPNTVLFDFAPDAGPADLRELLDEARFAAATGKSLLLLRRSADDERAAFGRRRHLHVWIDERDGDNAALMVLLAFILVGHPTWRKAHVSVSVAFPEEGHEVERERIVRTLTEGRLPIRQENIRFVPAGAAPEAGADLLLLGLDGPTLAGHEAQLVAHPELPSVLFVRAAERISIE